jgi:hypothetical protein
LNSRETFVDGINNISVKVIEETKTELWVVINSSSPNPLDLILMKICRVSIFRY